MYLKKVNVQDFSIETMQKICDSLNRGHTVEIKREREGKIVVIDIDRHVISKEPAE